MQFDHKLHIITQTTYLHNLL